MSSISDNTSSNFSKDENYYDILGIRFNAEQIDIRNAYNSLAEKWHPDKNKHPIANKKFLDINNAYQVLSNEQAKRNYNDALKSGTNFSYKFNDPFDVYNEFQSIKKNVESQFKDKLEYILCKLENKNIKYKTRQIVDKQLIVINDCPFEKITEISDSGITYITYIHQNGIQQTIMDENYLDIILKN